MENPLPDDLADFNCDKAETSSSLVSLFSHTISVWGSSALLSYSFLYVRIISDKFLFLLRTIVTLAPGISLLEQNTLIYPEFSPGSNCKLHW